MPRFAVCWGGPQEGIKIRAWSDPRRALLGASCLRAIRKALGAYIAVRRKRGWTIPRETEAAVSEIRIGV